MTNKKRIERELQKLGLKLGIYKQAIDKLNQRWIKKIIDNMEYGSTDILVYHNRKKHIIEVSHVDNEVDFNIMTDKAYKELYGRKFQEW